MSNVQFSEDQEYQPRIVKEKQGGLTSWVLKVGLAKDAKGAQTLMLGFSMAAVIIVVGVLALSQPRAIKLTPMQESVLKNTQFVRPAK